MCLLVGWLVCGFGGFVCLLFCLFWLAGFLCFVGSCCLFGFVLFCHRIHCKRKIRTANEFLKLNIEKHLHLHTSSQLYFSSALCNFGPILQ